MLRLIYRAYGGENDKPRPEYYSKSLALRSFLQAATAVDAEIVFLNNGPIAEDQRSLMRRHGELLEVPGGPKGIKASYAMALKLPADRKWPEEDFVYFSEDDYLYHPDAFTALSAAVTGVPQASYLSLYGSTPRHASREFPHGYRLPPTWPQQPEVTVGEQRWVNTMSTASTFGAQIGALNRDWSIFRQGMWPFRNRYWDHGTCLTLQAQRSFSGMEQLRGHPGEYPQTPWGLVRAYGLAPFRVALNVRAWSRRNDPHWLYVADPNLACHLENRVITPGRDWAQIAAQVGRDEVRAGGLSGERAGAP